MGKLLPGAILGFFPPWLEVGYEVDGFILSLFVLAELDIKLRSSWLENSL